MSAAKLLRPIHHADVPVLTRLEAEVYGPDAWSEQSWWAELAARPRRAYVVAQENGQVRGYAGLDLGPDVADVMTITVAPDARRGGWGTLLMEWLVETATRSGAEALMLEVRSDNEPAIELYRRWGFEQLSVRRGYYKGADGLIMRRLSVLDRPHQQPDRQSERQPDRSWVSTETGGGNQPVHISSTGSTESSTGREFS